MDGPDIAEAAVAGAWNACLLIHGRIDDNDARRAALELFIRQRCEAGDTDNTELLAVEGLHISQETGRIARRVRTRTVDRYREKVEQLIFPLVTGCITGKI